MKKCKWTAVMGLIFFLTLATPAMAAEGSDHMQKMIACAVVGDIQGGEQYAARRNEKIRNYSLAYPCCSFEDLYLTAKIIQAEAGSSWLSNDWQLYVGNVLLNRVSVEQFPSTISGCVYQRGQYYGSRSSRFANLLPTERAARNAARLLNGERFLPKNVVYQSNFKQGSGVHIALSDQYLGTTYFCYH